MSVCGTDGGDDFVRLPAKRLKHFYGVVKVAGFAKATPLVPDLGVGREENLIRRFAGEQCLSFGSGYIAHRFEVAEVLGRRFVGIAGAHRVGNSQHRQQFAAAGRTAAQHEAAVQGVG